MIVRVHTSVPYDVHIGPGLLEQAGVLLKPIVKASKLMLVSDEVVYELYGRKAEDKLKEAGFQVFVCTFKNGEQSKNIQTLADILEAAAEHGLTRKDAFVALGGGVTGDIAGLAASIYMRGVDFIQIPTTLLAAVDASVGGKTAIDLPQGKNLAGTFWQPRLVLCDVDIIRSLPQSIFNNGMAEVMKHGVIGDEAILDCIESGNVYEQLDWLIFRNVEIKCNVVERDEHEGGRRKILNFGHTIAHAIEKQSNYTVPHGIAVGTGMVYETRIAAGLGLCDEAFVEKLQGLSDTYKLFVSQDITEEFINIMKRDKKNEDDRIAFALPSKSGGFILKKLSIEQIGRALGLKQ